MINKQSKLTGILSSITLATALLFPINIRAAEPKLIYSPQTIEAQSPNQDYSWILRKGTNQENQSEQKDLDIKNIQNLYGKNPEELEKAKLDLIRRSALAGIRASVDGLDFVADIKSSISNLTERNNENSADSIEEKQRPRFRIDIRNKGELDFRIQRTLYNEWTGEIGTQTDYSGMGGNISISREKDKSKVRISAGEDVQKGPFLNFDYGFSY